MTPAIRLLDMSMAVGRLYETPVVDLRVNPCMRTLLLNRWLACLTGSSILVLKLTFSPDPFPRNPVTEVFMFSLFYLFCALFAMCQLNL